MRHFLIIGFIVVMIVALIFQLGDIFRNKISFRSTTESLKDNLSFAEEEKDLHPLSIELLKRGQYPGSDLTIEQELNQGVNYKQYIVFYRSEGLKIYSLLTVPQGEVPKSGWPAIIFNHGYIVPHEYRTTQRYIAYVDAFARNGYIVLKPDYRGHGNSEGEASGGYGSNGYTIDVLNAVSSIKKFKTPSTSSGQLVDPNRIGMWGHSMGGYITLRNMVVSKDIKAGVIWAGVVGSHADLINNWRRRTTSPIPNIPNSVRRWRQDLIDQYGTPEQNPKFWNSLSANSYLSNISGPVQLHHGTNDASVPISFSEKLNDQLKVLGKEVEFYAYEGDDHNITTNFNIAIQRSVEFFSSAIPPREE